ncbi:MAG: branched-chain amino acid ABC transporter permease [Desulfobacterales bacterium]
MSVDRRRRRAVILCVLILFFLAAPAFLSRYYLYLIGLILITGLLATSLNVVLGFGGMYQFHHAVFYGVGAYGFALVSMKSGLPPALGYVAAPVVAALTSLVIGLITLRLSKLYFGMLQLSLGALVWAIVYRWYAFTGGDDGIHGIGIPAAISSPGRIYYVTLGVTIGCLWLMYRLVNSPFGRIFQGIRDNPVRTEAIGVNVRRHQLAGQVIAGIFAGIAGALFVTVEGSVFPDLLSWTLSLELIIMCLLGGWHVFFGPLLGAAIIVVLRTFVGIYTEYWTLVLGIVLMLVIYFLPQGILGYFQRRPLAQETAGGEH